jgi:hypothetical protein
MRLSHIPAVEQSFLPRLLLLIALLLIIRAAEWLQFNHRDVDVGDTARLLFIEEVDEDYTVSALPGALPDALHRDETYHRQLEASPHQTWR